MEVQEWRVLINHMGGTLLVSRSRSLLAIGQLGESREQQRVSWLMASLSGNASQVRFLPR